MQGWCGRVYTQQNCVTLPQFAKSLFKHSAFSLSTFIISKTHIVALQRNYSGPPVCVPGQAEAHMSEVFQSVQGSIG